MPADYEAVRDSIYKDLVEKGWNKGKALKEAKKRAVIWWHKKHPGEKFTHSDASGFTDEEIAAFQFEAYQQLRGEDVDDN